MTSVIGAISLACYCLRRWGPGLKWQRPSDNADINTLVKNEITIRTSVRGSSSTGNASHGIQKTIYHKARLGTRQGDKNRSIKSFDDSRLKVQEKELHNAEITDMRVYVSFFVLVRMRRKQMLQVKPEHTNTFGLKNIKKKYPLEIERRDEIKWKYSLVSLFFICLMDLSIRFNNSFQVLLYYHWPFNKTLNY